MQISGLIQIKFSRFPFGKFQCSQGFLGTNSKFQVTSGFQYDL